jgi:hypothetical protein
MFIPGVASAADTADSTWVNAPQGFTSQFRPAMACWPDHGGIICYHRKSGEIVRVRPNGSKPKVFYAPTGIAFPKVKLRANQWTDVGTGNNGVFCVDTRPKANHVGCLSAKHQRYVVLVEKGQFHVVDTKQPIWKFWNYISRPLELRAEAHGGRPHGRPPYHPLNSHDP